MPGKMGTNLPEAALAAGVFHDPFEGGEDSRDFGAEGVVHDLVFGQAGHFVVDAGAAGLGLELGADLCGSFVVFHGLPEFGFEVDRLGLEAGGVDVGDVVGDDLLTQAAGVQRVF